MLPDAGTQPGPGAAARYPQPCVLLQWVVEHWGNTQSSTGLQGKLSGLAEHLHDEIAGSGEHCLQFPTGQRFFPCTVRLEWTRGGAEWLLTS